MGSGKHREEVNFKGDEGWPFTNRVIFGRSILLSFQQGSRTYDEKFPTELYGQRLWRVEV